VSILNNGISLSTTGDDLPRSVDVFVAFVTGGLGLGIIYIGGNSSSVVNVAIGATGGALAANVNTLFGSDKNKSFNYNGYLHDMGHYPSSKEINELELIRLITKEI
jgi:hypothetical protein